MKKTELLFHAIGEIDDELIEAAYPDEKLGKQCKRTRKYIFMIAACLSFSLVVGILVLTTTYLQFHSSSIQGGAGEAQSMVFVNGNLYVMTSVENNNFSTNAEIEKGYEFVGTIVNSVDSNQIPSEELQSNNTEVVGGSIYQNGNDLIIIADNQVWHYEKTS